MTKNDLKNDLCGSQEELYEKFIRLMKRHPQSIRWYAQEIGISSHTLWKFIRKDKLGFISACKIQNYIMNKDKEKG